MEFSETERGERAGDVHSSSLEKQQRVTTVTSDDDPFQWMRDSFDSDQ
jgi:hypothetical protein